MSIFGSIMSGIFGHSTPAAAAPAPSTPDAPAAAPTAPGAAPATPATGTSTPAAPAPDAPAATPSVASSTSAPAAPAQSVDVAAVLDGLAANASQDLDWKHSIVDMMKLLNIDSSLHARQELAKELHYSGDTNDSASMNIWLHKQVMQKLAENGGKLPADLAH